MILKKRSVQVVLGILFIAIMIWRPWHNSAKEQSTAKVISGLFETSVSAVGELQALEALDITIPEVSFRQEVNIWAIKILDIVEEGKIVKKNDHVATLEPTEVEENLVEVNKRLSDLYNSLDDAKLDSTLSLSQSRDGISKARELVVDKGIVVEQSSFESKAIQRQAQIELDKAQRALEKGLRDIESQRRKLVMQINRYLENIDRHEFEKKLLEEMMAGLDIKAPADGMIVYGRGYDGKKVKVGSMVGRWAPLIATLPDLNTLISEMYVKEIDISKIVMGQDVRIKVDAFPNKEYNGKIVKIANIGQEIPGTFQNGFKVLVKLDKFFDALLPGMTTTNMVITNRWENSLIIPRKGVFGTDSSRFVYQKTGLGINKIPIVTDGENDEFFRVIDGLDKQDVILLELPKK